MFALFVHEHSEQHYDLEGRIAYAEYKLKKRKFYADHVERNGGKVPTSAQVASWVEAQTYNVEDMREKAVTVLETYAELQIANVEEAIAEEGERRALASEAGKALQSLQGMRFRIGSFLLSVGASVTASLILGALLWFYLQGRDVL